MECACNDESIDAIKMTLHALAHVLLVPGNGLVLKDHVVECIWDGQPEALKVLSEYFGFPCRLCLQHSKKNTEKRYTGGFDQVVSNAVEMVAFQPRFAFSIAADALLESLVDAEQDTSYLTCVRVGGV